MKRNIIFAGAMCLAFFLIGCTIEVDAPPETRIKAENDLYNLSVVIGGISMHADNIDLQDVTIGDVFFPYIDGGETTAPKTTSISGNVWVEIDKAIVQIVGNVVDLVFNDIDDMEVYIKKNETNTVVFDEETGDNILSALGKKKAE